MSLLLRLSGTPSGENLTWCPIGRRPDSGVGPEARVFGRNAQIAALVEGRAEWGKPTLGGSSQWPSPTARGAKAPVALDVASI
jgi:hypothetical protein